MQNKYEITFDDFKKIQNESTIIDVRTPQEVAQTGMIKGATNVPLPTLGSEIAKVTGGDKSKTIILVCASGGRSMMASILVQDLGYSNAVSLKGGMNDYLSRK